MNYYSNHTNVGDKAVYPHHQVPLVLVVGFFSFDIVVFLLPT